MWLGNNSLYSRVLLSDTWTRLALQHNWSHKGVTNCFPAFITAFITAENVCVSSILFLNLCDTLNVRTSVCVCEYERRSTERKVTYPMEMPWQHNRKWFACREDVAWSEKQRQHHSLTVVSLSLSSTRTDTRAFFYVFIRQIAIVQSGNALSRVLTR